MSTNDQMIQSNVVPSILFYLFYFFLIQCRQLSRNDWKCHSPNGCCLWELSKKWRKKWRRSGIQINILILILAISILKIRLTCIPTEGLVPMLRTGMIALQLLPSNCLAGVVVFTDGCTDVYVDQEMIFALRIFLIRIRFWFILEFFLRKRSFLARKRKKQSSRTRHRIGCRVFDSCENTDSF